MMVDEMDMPPPIRNIRGRWPPKPRGGRGGRRVGHPPRGPPPDFDPHFEYPPLARGGGHMNRPSGRPGNRPPGRPGNRPPPPGYDPDGESDIGLGGAPSRPFHPMHDEDDDDFPPTSGFPGMGGNHGMPPPPRHSPLRRGRGGHGSMDDGPLGNERPRPHQAQVEDDPEGMS
ncbi:hypothetical protein BU23DRAFT_604115 [Bimuria novae-zelandiae CBS 107.79]|uniref:Uncharacterized protein n=1 Tax=Bimuria novae-zelandiae CBS 107.79 TaxID=1447943 RepID=A0A6A5UK67_9PLEO|nr:hypothetical protein BU23DRAFT_604115 [Bimuria novae-zelandiae CBS 107.79]